MDYNTLLTVVGTTATLIFGFVGIYLPLRKSYSSSLDFIQSECVNLYDSVVKNISDLSIQFKNTPIKNNIYLLRGFLINSGSRDITPQMIEKSLSVMLNESSKWLNVNVIGTSKDIIVKVNYLQNVLVVETGLLRYGEFVFIECLIESDTAKTLQDELHFEHRIANTHQPSYILIDDLNVAKEIIYNLSFAAFIILLLMFSGINSLSSVELSSEHFSQSAEGIEKRPDESYQKNGISDTLISDSSGFYDFNLTYKQLDSISALISAQFDKWNESMSRGDLFEAKLKTIEDYSYLQLFLKGESKRYYNEDGSYYIVSINSKTKLYFIIISLLCLFAVLVFLSSNIIKFFRWRPVRKQLGTELHKRTEDNIA